MTLLLMKQFLEMLNGLLGHEDRMFPCGAGFLLVFDLELHEGCLLFLHAALLLG